MESYPEGSCALTSKPIISQTFVEHNTAFGLRVYKEIAAASTGNIVFSPWGLSSALAMSYAGARGQTLEEMSKTLGFSVYQDRLHRAFRDLRIRFQEIQRRGKITLRVANGLLRQQNRPLLRTFNRLISEYYGTLIASGDGGGHAFNTSNSMDDWVADCTLDKIREMAAPGPSGSSARLAVVTSVYFKAAWEHRFEETSYASFQVTPKQRVEVPMMMRSEYMRCGEVGETKILELPYVDGEVTMTILLPKRIDELETSLSVDALNLWRLSLERAKVRVYLPRFRITMATPLGHVLRRLGMTLAFSPGADFSGIDGSTELYIAEVLHKAFVRVDEEGTEAAAIIAPVFMVLSAEPVFVFRADRPFLFLIQDTQTGTILFIGRVKNPTSP